MKRATTWLLSITIALCAAGGTPVGMSVRWTSPSSITRAIATRAVHKSTLQNRAPIYPRRSGAARVWLDEQFEKLELSKVLYQRPPPAILL